MSLRELLSSGLEWAGAHGAWLLAVAVIWPVAGTLAAWVLRHGRTDRDGRWVANVVIGGAVLQFVVAVTGLLLAQAWLETSVLDVDLRLPLAPLLCLGLSVAGIHAVFPLTELASVRTLRDAGLFLLACAVVVWLLAKFRGWGVVFFGGLGDLVLIGVLAWALLGRLYRRMVGGRGPV